MSYLCWLGLLLLALSHRVHGSACPKELLPLEEDCKNTFDHDSTTCDASTGHYLYRYTQVCDPDATDQMNCDFCRSHEFNQAGSCSACTCNGYTGDNTYEGIDYPNEFWNTGPRCCNGWNGTECNLCQDVGVCPPIYDEKTNQTIEAYRCSQDSVVPTSIQETIIGKQFSCSCGSEGDSFSAKTCPLQGQYCDKYDHYDEVTREWTCGNDGSFTTRFDWTFFGIGSDDSPGEIKLAQNAGIKGYSMETTPEQFRYYYPIVWAGTLSNCVISKGYCMDVPNIPDVAKQQCYNFVCGKTDISCPPEGYEECPGGANHCDNVPGYDDKTYYMHKCNVVPDNSGPFQISCLQEANNDGSFVCYYNQGDQGYSPMSMTCNVGQCLYNTSNYTDDGGVEYDVKNIEAPSGIEWQLNLLLLIGGVTIAFFGLIEIIRRSVNRYGNYLWKRFIDTENAKISNSSTLVNPASPIAAPLLSSETQKGPISIHDGAELCWENVNLWVPSKVLKTSRSKGSKHDEKQILRNVNGRAPEGSITALMGPSGAGKTSLLDCLASRKKMHRVQRHITVNRNKCSSDAMQAVSGYVEQHDVLPSMFTVREHLLFHARLRFRTTTVQRRYRVEHVIKILNLSKCADTRIGGELVRGLSGGERRRLSVAEELLVEPRILFLDEPTTGLDSSTAMELVQTLVSIAENGQTVLLSIHQPRRDIFEMFHRIIVLCKGGKVVYEGSPRDVEKYLQKASTLGLATLMEGHERLNPADVLLDVASENSAFKLASAFASGEFSTINSDMAASYENGASPVHRNEGLLTTDELSDKYLKAAERKMANPVLQFIVLSTRLVQTAIRHPMLLCLQYFGALFLALSLGHVFQGVQDDLYGVQDRFGVLFFIPFCLILLGMSSLPVWRDEHILFTHEYGNKRIHGFGAYFLSVIFFDLILIRTIPPLSFAVISYKQIGLNKYCDSCLLYFALILVLTNIISALVAMTIGAFRFNSSFSNLIGSILSLAFALFGGFLVNRNQLKKFPIYDLDPLAYSFEALMINEFGNQKQKDGNSYFYTINGSWCAKGLTTVYPTGNELLSTFSFSNTQKKMRFDIYSLWTGALYCIALAFTVLLISSRSTDGAVYLRRAIIHCLRFCSGRTRSNPSESFDSTSDLVSEESSEVVDTVDVEEAPDTTNPVLEVEAGAALLTSSPVASSETSENFRVVLSFHDITYAAPEGPCSRICKSIESADAANVSDIVFTATLPLGEILGIHIVHRESDQRAVVRQVMMNCWAHKSGVRALDEIESIGGRMCTFREVQELLANVARPVDIVFHRRARSWSSVESRRSSKVAVTNEKKYQGDPKEKNILKGVSGSTIPCKQGEVLSSDIGPMYTAIMGPSGAGKTTLLDILAGRKASGFVGGRICLNGYPVNPKEMRQLSGYVTQEDILPGSLTVREYLMFQAYLRISTSALDRKNVRAEAVTKRLAQLNLTGCGDSPIGNQFNRGISGGEKRRVSVAVELLSEPAILYLDEPTTGLDSTTAVNLTAILRDIARDGTTVIMSIHQPRLEIFEMITQVIMLTKDGRVGYCGPTLLLHDYSRQEIATIRKVTSADETEAFVDYESGLLENAKNPADRFLDEMRTLQPQDIANCFATSEVGQAQAKVLAALADKEENEHTEGLRVALSQLGLGGEFKLGQLLSMRRKYVAPWTSQVWALSIRCLQSVARNPLLMLVHGATAAICAVALGLVFKDIHQKDDETAGMQDRFGIMFFLVMYLSLLALTSLPLWREEQRLFKAERGSGVYGASSYVLATVFFDVLPYRLLPPCLFTAIAYPLIDLNNGEYRQLKFLILLILFNLTVSGLCMLIGVLTSSNASANAAGSLAMLTSILFCG